MGLFLSITTLSSAKSFNSPIFCFSCYLTMQQNLQVMVDFQTRRVGRKKKRKIPWNCFLSKGEFECGINKQPNTSCCLHGIRGRLQGWVLRETLAVIMSRLPLHEVQSCRRKGGNEECSEKGVVQWEIAVIPFCTGLCKCADGRFYLAAWIQFSRLLEVWCLHRVKEEVL